ncbi:uncharacterized protein N7459_006397 [Penicillium hispanicum]|uniref:uncharacterized protein n=1 Tax=Penicillium hispanicum TaxID=1080232 RepID=UPI00254173EC|nr:uncharacterized protein N7459_006397 [Penicillium hispanicum]KAJ5577433.1 hypothetical protein N7459_006397 [Penicillium hispanicum]
MDCLASIVSLLLSLVNLSSLLPLRGQPLQLRYPGGEWIMPGTTLNTLDTGMIPEISSIGLNCHRRYIVVFLDLDVTIPDTGIETVVLHWYQPDLVFNCTPHHPPAWLLPDGDLVSPSEAPYIAPQPPPTSHHRYLYLLFVQPEGYQFPKCFSHIPPKTVEARGGFDIRQFMDAAGLDQPVALNYFFARKDVPEGEKPPVLPSATTTSFRTVSCTPAPTSVQVREHRS